MINRTIKILCTTLVFMVGLHANAQEVKYVIEGRIANLKFPKKVFLTYVYNNAEIVDSTEAKGGRFVFKGTLPEPVRASVYCKPTNQRSVRDNRLLYLGAGKTLLESKDSLKYASIKGPQLVVDYDKFEESMKPYIQKLGEIRIKAYKLDKVKDKTLIDNMQIEYDKNLENIYSSQSDFLDKHKGSHSSLLIIQTMAGNSFDRQDLYTKFKALDVEVRSSPLGKRLDNAFDAAMRLGKGKTLPNFSAPDTIGNMVSLDQVRQLGKLTLVDFWASWCVPCRAENPNLKKLYADYHDKGLNILAVSLDRSANSWKQAINQDVLPWYHISNLKYWDEPIAKELLVSAVPDSFLLDAEGKIIARGLRGEKLREVVDKLLSK